MTGLSALKRYIALLAVASAVLAAACGSDVTGTAEHVPDGAVALAAQSLFMQSGGYSGFSTPARLLITNRSAWAATWAKLYANSSEVPPLPAIDFSHSVIVLVAMGTRPTGGYSITISAVSAHAGVLYVSVLERSPGPSCGTTQALTAPIDIVEVPRQGTRARFIDAQDTYAC